jgi:NAD-dependent deacetylase
LHALITQNIDELHQIAGNSPELVIEVHGTMRRAMCWQCGERTPMLEALARLQAGEADPNCRSCGGILKSDTIYFGQALDQGLLARAMKVAREADVMIAVGTTLQVYPIAEAVPIAQRAGARIVIVNGEATALDDLADALLRGPISELLPAIC